MSYNINTSIQKINKYFKTMCLLIHLNILIKTIFSIYYKDSICAFVISDTKNGIDYQGWLPIVNIKKNNVSVLEIESLLWNGCQDVVIHTENPSHAIEAFEAAIKLQVQRFNDRRYLILPSASSEGLADLPSLPALQFVPDVLVAVPQIDYNASHRLIGDCETTFQLITHRFVGTTGNEDIVQLDVWHSRNFSFETGANLFPDKITDMQGRIFKMATFNYKPYSIVG